MTIFLVASQILINIKRISWLITTRRAILDSQCQITFHDYRSLKTNRAWLIAKTSALVESTTSTGPKNTNTDAPRIKSSFSSPQPRFAPSTHKYWIWATVVNSGKKWPECSIFKAESISETPHPKSSIHNSDPASPFQSVPPYFGQKTDFFFLTVMHSIIHMFNCLLAIDFLISTHDLDACHCHIQQLGIRIIYLQCSLCYMINIP